MLPHSFSDGAVLRNPTKPLPVFRPVAFAFRRSLPPTGGIEVRGIRPCKRREDIFPRCLHDLSLLLERLIFLSGAIDFFSFMPSSRLALIRLSLFRLGRTAFGQGIGFALFRHLALFCRRLISPKTTPCFSIGLFLHRFRRFFRGIPTPWRCRNPRLMALFYRKPFLWKNHSQCRRGFPNRPDLLSKEQNFRFS